MQKRSRNSSLRSIAVVAALVLGLGSASPAQGGEPPVRVTELMTRPLPNAPDQEATMIVVDYAPGAADPVHRHDASAFVYVLEGRVEMQMKGGEMVTLGPGQTFYEDPSGVHLVGRNASKTEPAKFVVLLVKKRGAPILTSVSE